MYFYSIVAIRTKASVATGAEDVILVLPQDWCVHRLVKYQLEMV